MCYMFTAKKRYGQDPNVVVRSSDKTFYAPLKWKSRKVFVCSWSDFFIEEADAWRADAWDVIRQRPDHTWQILTKRPERIRECLPEDWGEGWPSVWFGVSVEDQKSADERIPPLLQIPAAIYFVSAEPLLGPIDFQRWLHILWSPRDSEWWPDPFETSPSAISQIIVGAESGPNRRPFNVAWAEDIYDQCQAAGVKFFGKQASAFRPGAPLLIHGQEVREFPE